MLCRLIVIATLLSSTAVAAVRVEPETPKAGQMVRVFYDTGDRVGVIAKGDYEVDQFDTKAGVLLFTGAGRFTVIGFTADGGFFSKDVSIGTIPPPVPPVPPTPVPPTPVPPDDSVVDTFGFGKFTYAKAREIGDPAGAKVLAAVWSEAANKMFNNRADVPEAIKFIEAESNKQLAGSAAKWAPWARAMEVKFRDAKIESVLDHVRAFKEVSRALESAAK